MHFILLQIPVKRWAIQINWYIEIGSRNTMVISSAYFFFTQVVLRTNKFKWIQPLGKPQFFYKKQETCNVQSRTKRQTQWPVNLPKNLIACISKQSILVHRE